MTLIQRPSPNTRGLQEHGNIKRKSSQKIKGKKAEKIKQENENETKKKTTPTEKKREIMIQDQERKWWVEGGGEEEQEDAKIRCGNVPVPISSLGFDLGGNTLYL